jgi:eukaryotic-like serine/threonine-protein kinase
MSVGENPTPNVDPLLSQVVADRYKVLRKLGEGGMGSVYLAEHVVIEKKFALKVLAPELARRPDLVARFLQEARSASRIGHENVIDISDFGQSPDGLVFIAMEFLDGRDLGEIVRSQGAMDWPQARDIVLQICRALRAAHDKGIVHRDMKPENIFLIHREGQPHFVKILDFGIAKVMGLDPNGPRLTRTGMIFGTPEYMAPEQAEGKDTDHRADIYAVGCILYHLLTGQTPFVAESFMTMLTKHLMEDPVAPSQRRPDLPISPEMDALVLKALEKDRDQRWQSMAELLEAVSTCSGPEAAPKQPIKGQTIAMGGAGAPAAIRPARPKNETHKLSRKSVDAALSSAEMGQAPAAPSSRKTIVLVSAGVALGVGVAAWLALSPRGKPTEAAPPIAPAPTAAAQAPVPVPPPAPPPVAVPIPAAAPTPVAQPAVAVVEEKPSPSEAADHKQHAGRGKKGKTLGAESSPVAKSPSEEPKPAAPAEAKPKPSPAPTPGELKPFPKM